MNISVVPETAYLFMLIFARMGTMFMLMPAFGERMISPRIRLVIALLFSFMMFPLVSTQYPGLPNTILAALPLLVREIGVGLIIGATARLLLSAAQVAGSTIAFQSGLASAQVTDPTLGGQGAIFGNFIALLGIAAIFAMDLHHLILAGIHDSYILFKPGGPLMLDDAVSMALNVIAGSFTIGVQLAAPFIVFGLLFYLGLGILARLMPQIQIFFIAMPANILLGLLLFFLLLPVIMGWYLEYIEQGLRTYVAGAP